MLSIIPLRMPLLRSILLGLACLGLSTLPATVIINEVMTSNSATLADEDGEYADWIELLNTGPSAVSLENWALSDDPRTPARWRFPAEVLPAGGRLLVWASGKNRRVVGSPLHASFRLSAEGEWLGLVRANLSEADGLVLPALPSDLSFGRWPDGGAAWRYFEDPSPGAPNRAPAYESLLAPPGFSREAGLHPAPFSLEIASSDPGVEIRYTLDGSVPGPHSPVYSGPLSLVDRSPQMEVFARINTGVQWANPPNRIAKGTVVRARAFRSGARPSAVTTGTYWIGPSFAQRYRMAMVSIAVDHDAFFGPTQGIYVNGSAPTGQENWRQRGRDWEREIHLEMFEEDGARVLSQGAGARIHGGATRQFAQKSLRLYARSEYGASRFDYPVFPHQPYPFYKRLMLRNGGNDTVWSLMRDFFLQTLVGHMGFDTLAYRPAVVFINGEYWGFHAIRERYDRHYLERVHGAPEGSVDLLYWRDSPRLGDNRHYRQMIAFMENNDLALSSNYETVGRMMDIQNFMAYHIAQIYINNIDWPANNNQFWRYRATDLPGPDVQGPLDGRWRWLMYDVDFGFGIFWNSDPNHLHNENHNTLAFATAPNSPENRNAPFSTFILRQLLRNESFRHAFINRFADEINTTFRTNRVLALFEPMWDVVWPGYPTNKTNPPAASGFEHMNRWPAMVLGWGPQNSYIRIRRYAQDRPAIVRRHIEQHFSLPGQAALTVDRSSDGGHLWVNSIRLDGETLGLDDPSRPYPWTGQYFRTIPITVRAVPAKGFRFDGWEPPFASVANPTITLALNRDTTLTARFLPLSPTDDSDGDGVPDLFDPDPDDPSVPFPDGRASPLLSQLALSGGRLAFSARVTPPYRYRLLWSVDLERWEEIPFQPAGSGAAVLLHVPSEAGYLKASLPLPEGAPASFFRWDRVVSP